MNIIHKVISSHSMKYSIKTKKEIDVHVMSNNKTINKASLRLMIQFCKHYKIMSSLYQVEGRNSIFSNFFDFGYRLFSCLRVDATTAYQMSQLWRFFALDAIKNKKEYKCLCLYRPSLEHIIQCNGYRDSDEIKNLFKKHNLLPKN